MAKGHRSQIKRERNAKDVYKRKMSTADSQLLAAASSVSQNILQEALHKKMSQKTSMLAARLTVIGIAILGVIIARDPSSSIFGIVSFAWAGFGAALDVYKRQWYRSSRGKTAVPGRAAWRTAG